MPWLSGTSGVTDGQRWNVAVGLLSRVKVWTGTEWRAAPVKTWTGTEWRTVPVKAWDGTTW